MKAEIIVKTDMGNEEKENNIKLIARLLLK